MWPTVISWIPPFKVKNGHTQQHKLGIYWSWCSSSNLESIDTKIGSKWGCSFINYCNNIESGGGFGTTPQFDWKIVVCNCRCESGLSDSIFSVGC